MMGICRRYQKLSLLTAQTWSGFADANVVNFGRGPNRPFNPEWRIARTLLQREHTFQGNSGPVSRLLIYADLVDDLALDQSFQNPGEIGRVYAVHGGARTDNRIKTEDELLWMFFCQAMHQVNLGSNSPLSSSRSFLDLLNNKLG